ncbi:unnamed protein product [Moneuplotes crassus]|uniref:Uncharacterized protein n=1 Tax=Euplotes crassus TaxID=5936 RepID=A0AAD1XQW8_EUPCR|nr:unnamed protein product [Moneuplotes crassus]
MGVAGTPISYGIMEDFVLKNLELKLAVPFSPRSEAIFPQSQIRKLEALSIYLMAMVGITTSLTILVDSRLITCQEENPKPCFLNKSKECCEEDQDFRYLDQKELQKIKRDLLVQKDLIHRLTCSGQEWKELSKKNARICPLKRRPCLCEHW